MVPDGDNALVMTLTDAAWTLAGSAPPAQAVAAVLCALRGLAAPDAIAVLTLSPEGDLHVLAQHGLAPRCAEVCFCPTEHPRLRLALASPAPLRFTDPTEPDPYDGLLAAQAGAVPGIHACIAAPLRVDGDPVGLLTVDALAAHGLDGLRSEELGLASALLSTALKKDRDRGRDRQRAGAWPGEEDGGDPLLRSRSPAMSALLREVDVLAPLPLPVLILGETGVGKELLARALHARSPRKIGPFLAVNCAALPAHLIEAELFGHTRGAFTGAGAARRGKFAAASGGILFLDEVGELPAESQAVLLRALDAGVIQRVGEDTERAVDVRVVAATNRDLTREVAAGRFRADLYHRLAVYPLRVPPLRERPEDVLPLAEHFAGVLAAQVGAPLLPLSPEVAEVLRAAPWPGNVRELKSTLERALLRALLRTGDPTRRTPLRILPQDIDLPLDLQRPAAPLGSPDPPLPLHDALEQARAQALRQALSRCGGNVAAAARLLGISRSFAYKEAARLGLLPSS
jgi:anaerobic nitric oxide reductase transcription regulator